MNTPICDFVKKYAEDDKLRLHMPGHKGKSFLGLESLDITEIDGADVLYNARGIIKQSEDNAASLFKTEKTVYSCEGSSLAIRAMLNLALLHAKAIGKRPIIAAGRNAHKTFLTAAALLDLDVEWIYPKKQESVVCCKMTPDDLEAFLQDLNELPTAVYITSPDYLGNMADIKSLAKVCEKYDVLLLVDNAHGAYLSFLDKSQHPIALGAHACCDSAHKTLPVLTGGAYLHISPNAPKVFSEQAENAMALFASTSPSYLILQSLDLANKYLAQGYNRRLNSFVLKLDLLKEALAEAGYTLIGNEPLKLTISAKPYGYTGDELAKLLLKEGIVCEFADPDYLVLMLTPENDDADLSRLKSALSAIPKKEEFEERPLFKTRPVKKLRPREAMLSPSKKEKVYNCVGKVLASANVSCPPAIPIVVCGEVIDENAITLLNYYGIEECDVVI
ncbi:MAG: aminotransferase class I/II-fold pyridoxal phosphate-dependent enzyme [Oscillospiraceae bacterium]|nr:aminotransferase class I/II-fold pyridoxal phosphate-dependent enzyme [Oscillospiraceae bacterium]